MRAETVDDTVRMPKRKRRKLAKSELYMLAAIWAQSHADDVGDKGDETIPFGAWPEDDPIVIISETYRLSQRDLERLMTQIAQELEDRAIRLGY